MKARFDRDTIEQRLAAHLGAGERLLAWGWGTLGMKNVLTAATSQRLLLEFVSIGLRTREVQSMPYGSLEAVETRKGDSTIPGWAKLNLQLAAMSAFTTSLVLKKVGEPPFHILFRPMPRLGDNRGAALEIGRIIMEMRPELPTSVDYAGDAGDSRRPGCATALRWGVVGGVVLAVPVGVALGGPEGFAAGFFAGALVAGLFSFFWAMIRRSFTGTG
ncbi:hypothetical protein JW921_10635 [Candidatus Fermentibacterales bacterium]|nr:hypothetical protein [Candidatus Fermentibacterales bacterium]